MKLQRVQVEVLLVASGSVIRLQMLKIRCRRSAQRRHLILYL